MLGNGEVVKCSRVKEPDLFWATLGGLGLTGVVIEAELQLCRIDSTYASSIMMGFDGIDQLVELIETHKSKYEYILGWADGGVGVSSDWRGAVSFGRNMKADEVGEAWNLPALKPCRLPFPNPLPSGRITARLINYLIGREFRDGKETVTDLYRFFFPQELFSNWNIAFGPGGFIDYQCCIPYPKASDCLKQVQQILIESRIQCFLIVFKRFGTPEREGYFSFPMDGFSFTVEAPIQKNIYEILDQLDEVIVGFGGRLNPVKDSRTSPGMLKRMYPKLDRWLAVKQRYDPKEKFRSDMSRRLELTS
jgi:decaprenylphospho-beta-D-ribofuranose 2-oxidase